MPQRNGYRSSRGRSAVARKAMFSGVTPTAGMMPSVLVKTTDGKTVRTSYFGGPKKGGAAPSATGYMRAPSTSQSFHSSVPAKRPNYLFKFRQNYGGLTVIGGPLL